MKKISIVKSGGLIANQVELPDLEADAWLAKHVAMETFGKAAYSYEQEVTPAVYGNGAEILDENDQSFDPPQYEQVIVTPAVMETINISAEYEVQELDITTESASAGLKATKISEGRAARQACENVLDLVAGFNLDRALTSQQITDMQAMFSQIEQVLRASRPSTAKALITAMVPDGDLVTQEMKDLCLELLENY